MKDLETVIQLSSVNKKLNHYVLLLLLQRLTFKVTVSNTVLNTFAHALSLHHSPK